VAKASKEVREAICHFKIGDVFAYKLCQAQQLPVTSYDIDSVNSHSLAPSLPIENQLWVEGRSKLSKQVDLRVACLKFVAVPVFVIFRDRFGNAARTALLTGDLAHRNHSRKNVF
jgi:hypothetical protein